MANLDQTYERLVNIAPAPADARPNGAIHQANMLYACQQCAHRKIKCDKASPVCASCRRGRHECIYQTPPPRRRKRKLSGDGGERLARYERILRQHDLLPEEDDTTPSNEATPDVVPSLRYLNSETSRTGKLLAGQGKSR